MKKLLFFVLFIFSFPAYSQSIEVEPGQRWIQICVHDLVKNSGARFYSAFVEGPVQLTHYNPNNQLVFTKLSREYGQRCAREMKMRHQFGQTFDIWLVDPDFPGRQKVSLRILSRERYVREPEKSHFSLIDSQYMRYRTKTGKYQITLKLNPAVDGNPLPPLVVDR